jgi:N-methylhydantoinase B
VAAGNVETSQRLVDVLLGALARAVPALIPAASCGSMNNVAMGGSDNRHHRPFAYYETIGGGMGGRPSGPGLSAIHTHMTNTMNTPVEALEHAYPLRIERYGIRANSGGAGRHRGGDGIVRSYRFTEETEVSLFAERYRLAPYGLAGGRPGRPGRSMLQRGKRRKILPGKVNFTARPGDLLIIETAGGGGWGEVEGETGPASRK